MVVRAALILGGVGVLAAMEFVTPSRSQKAVAEPPSVQLVPQVGARDTLTRADRSEEFRLLAPAPFVPPPRPAAPAEPVSAESSSAVAPLQPAGAAKAAVVLPKPKPEPKPKSKPKPKPDVPAPRHIEARRPEPMPIAPKHAASDSAAKPDHPRPRAEARSCQANAFAGLLKALNLPGGCET
jgi:hypothetical protein